MILNNEDDRKYLSIWDKIMIWYLIIATPFCAWVEAWQEMLTEQSGAQAWILIVMIFGAGMYESTKHIGFLREWNAELREEVIKTYKETHAYVKQVAGKAGTL